MSISTISECTGPAQVFPCQQIYMSSTQPETCNIAPICPIGGKEVKLKKEKVVKAIEIINGELSITEEEANK